jgi:hypothetical protein
MATRAKWGVIKIAEETKCCLWCRSTFPLREFPSDAHNPDRLSNFCVDCTNVTEPQPAEQAPVRTWAPEQWKPITTQGGVFARTYQVSSYYRVRRGTSSMKPISARGTVTLHHNQVAYHLHIAHLVADAFGTQAAPAAPQPDLIEQHAVRVEQATEAALKAQEALVTAVAAAHNAQAALVGIHNDLDRYLTGGRKAT